MAILAGREKDSALLKQEDVKQLAAGAPDLVTCGAVRTRSDEACGLLAQGQAEECRRTRGVYDDLRDHPNSRAFMYDEREFEQCKATPALAPACETLRKAFLAADPNQCVVKADFESICRSAKAPNIEECVTQAPRIMEAHCRAKITLDESKCDVPGADKKMADECRRDIRAKKAYAKDLKELAASGTAREKEFAKAALDDPDACKSLTQSAIDACQKGLSAAGSAGTPRSGGAEKTPAPEKPKGPSSPGTTPHEG